MRRPAHPTGFYIQFAEQLDLRQNARLHALHRALRADLLPGVTDLSPSYVNLYVEYDEALIDTEAVRGWARRHLRTCEDGAAAGGRLIEVPVRYDGPDLPDVAGRTGLSEAEVIRLHCAPDYHVYAVGFTPGFPFLGEVAEVLRLPRRSTPRATCAVQRRRHRQCPDLRLPAALAGRLEPAGHGADDDLRPQPRGAVSDRAGRPGALHALGKARRRRCPPCEGPGPPTPAFPPSG